MCGLIGGNWTSVVADLSMRPHPTPFVDIPTLQKRRHFYGEMYNDGLMSVIYGYFCKTVRREEDMLQQSKRTARLCSTRHS